MAIKPRQMLVSSSKYSIKCPYSLNAEYITFHNTANDASAQNEVSYMIGNNSEISFHFAVDDKEVVQGLPMNRNAWHTGDGSKGDGNRKSIGIEVCYSKSGGDKYKKAEVLAIKFIAQLLFERGWGIDRVRTHKSWTEIGVKKGYSSYVKNCPHRVLDEGRWDAVLKAIDNELKILKGQSSKSTDSKPKDNKTPVSPASSTQPKPTGNLGLVDWMNANKMDSSFANRSKLATKYGIKNYSGTSDQNTTLLAKLQGDRNVKSIAPKVESKPVVKKKYVQLPKTDSSWRVYPLGKACVKGNEKGSLNPKKFGGLEYEVLGNPEKDIYTIQTSDFGKVNIYAAPSTGAKIIMK